MVLALVTTIIFGLFSILLSFKIDQYKASSLKERKEEEDRLFKLSTIKDVQEKIAYCTDPEKIINTIMASLQIFFDYSSASSMVIKDGKIIFDTYLEENVNEEYLKKIEGDMLFSFGKLIGQIPQEITRRMYGAALNNASKSIYLSSFHIPLIANNKVLALIHLSSFKENAFANTKDLYDLVESASSALTHFEQSVGQETEKFLSLINSLNDGIFLIDDKNNLLKINNQAKEVLGITGNTSYAGILNIFGQNIDLENKIKNVLLTKNPYFEKQVKINDKALDIFINPVEPDKASIILRDVTLIKQKEQEKEDLIHIMVHELRAPTTSIKDSAELIITSKDTLEEEKQMKFLEIIHTQAKKVLGQIGSILDTAKLDAGRLVLQKAKGDITKLIQEEIHGFLPQAERKNINLQFEVMAKNLPEVSFDEIRVSQVIDNLLSNSMKFTPEGGKIEVKLDYKVIPPIIDGYSPMGEFLSLDKYITVSVSDSGVGIAPEQQRHLFSKYIQAKNNEGKLPSMGTGLGLYLAKGIIEAHEGRIWVKSEQGKGTTFTFTLPANNSKTAEEGILKQSATPLLKLSQTIN